ncbi:MAG: hypothetical protein QOH34_968, partial [Mycobacterium sp.]|nr:hypothetical protein [Mycobacterium sp.]
INEITDTAAATVTAITKWPMVANAFRI